VALASISLRGFRNLVPTIVELASGPNYLFGPNGAGKTNLLEAIHYLAIGRSFRRCPDAELLGFDRDVLVVSGIDESGTSAEIRFDGREKRIFRNGIPVEKLSEYFGWLPVVVLLLEDIELVRGAPGIRRNFLDVAIAKTGRRVSTDYADYADGVRTGDRADRRASTDYADYTDGAGAEDRTKAEARRPEAELHHKDTKTLSEDQTKSEVRRQSVEGRSEEQSYIALMGDYRRAVGQYNRLLEKGGGRREEGGDELTAWEEEVVRRGVPVYEVRMARLPALLESAARHYERLAGHEADLSYRSSVATDGTRSEMSDISVMSLRGLATGLVLHGYPQHAAGVSTACAEKRTSAPSSKPRAVMPMAATPSTWPCPPTSHTRFLTYSLMPRPRRYYVRARSGIGRCDWLDGAWDTSRNRRRGQSPALEAPQSGTVPTIPVMSRALRSA
jgi:recombinational DNA repair ATPase RecF